MPSELRDRVAVLIGRLGGRVAEPESPTIASDQAGSDRPAPLGDERATALRVLGK